jgi:hypothetical protein
MGDILIDLLPVALVDTLWSAMVRGQLRCSRENSPHTHWTRSYVDESGMVSLLLSDGKMDSTAWKLLVETMGFASRPRKYEVGQALARLRGIVLEEVPVMDDGSDAAAAAEAERKKAELMEIWNARRKNKLNDE